MVRAQARGVVDFREATRDSAWWFRARLLMEAMDQDDELHWLQAALTLQTALLGNGQLQQESFEGAQKRARSIFNEIVNTTMPWAAKSQDERAQEDIDKAAESYRRLVGDTRSPEFQKKIEEHLRLRRELMDRGRRPVETVDEKLNRKIRERDRKRKPRTR